MWKTIGSKTICENKFLKLKEDQVVLPNGNKSKYYVLERRDFTLVIAKNKNKFFLINQYRYPKDAWSLEFVEGGIEEGETPEFGAKRELEEETALKADGIRKIGHHWLANGYSSQSYHIYVAENCVSSGKRKLDEHEDGLEVVELTESQINEKIKNNEIKDAPTIAAWAMYLLHYDKR
jgi:8-oxo-dGTP pyrophosphatase MutT (NUDIX family)